VFTRERALEQLAAIQNTVLRLVATAAVVGVRVAARLTTVRSEL
jgi:hypothetical protein